jgi:hypothetical protein
MADGGTAPGNEDGMADGSPNPDDTGGIADGSPKGDDTAGAVDGEVVSAWARARGAQLSVKSSISA